MNTLVLLSLLVAGMPSQAPALSTEIEPVTITVFDHYTIDPIEAAQVTVWKDGQMVGLGSTGADGRVVLEIAGVHISGEVPDGFHLSRNYPNPFTSETRFDITAPRTEHLRYEVFNLLGQRVLWDGIDLKPGRQSVSLAMAHLPAGVYFLRVNGPLTETIRLVKVGSGTIGERVAGPAPAEQQRIMVTPQSLPLEGAYSIRVERSRYASSAFSVDLSPGTQVEVHIERNNRIAFVVEDEHQQALQQELLLQGPDSTLSFSTADTLIVRSGTYAIASPAGSEVRINTRIELPSVDTLFVLRADAPATATVSGIISNTLDERMSGIPVRAYHEGQLVAETQSIAEGRFELTIPATGAPVSLVADAVASVVPGFDPNTYQNYSRAAELLTPFPGRSYEVSFLLRLEWPMTVAGADPDTLEVPLALSTPGGSVIVAGIPRDLDIVAGSARAYSPTIDPGAFPGEFSTRQDGFESGLISGGFVSVNLLRQNGSGFEAVRELRDAEGNPVPVQLRFRLAREDWFVIQDPAAFSYLPGYRNRPDTLSAPLYYYDEAKGDWLLNESFGWIEDIDGPLSPGAVPQIQDGSHPNELYMVGYVTHFTFYNLDNPQRDACFAGRLLDQDSNPVADAPISFYSPPGTALFSYWSNIQKVTTSPTGHFQVRVPRTERGPGDDWNQNDKVDSFRAFARYEDKDACGLTIFDNNGAGYATPDFPEVDACRNLGILRVELRQARKRTINITFLDIVRDGQPNTPLFVDPPSMSGLNHAVGTLLDNRVPIGGSVWQCVCDGADLNEACHYQATTNSAGRAQFRIPVLLPRENDPLDILEYLTGTFSYRKLLPDLAVGAYEFAGCGYLVPENRTSETTRCEVERRGPPEIEILEPAPTDTINGNPVRHFLYDDPVTLRATGTDVNEKSIDPLNMFYWSGPGLSSILNGRVRTTTAAAAFGVGNGRSIKVSGIDLYGWLGEASLGGVTVEPVAITLQPDSLRLTPGRSDTLVATVTGANNTDVLWSSADPAIASVGGGGLVTGVAPGQTMITARSAADLTKSTTATIEVANLVAQFSVSPPLGDSTTVFTFDASASVGEIANYAWDFGDGNTGAGEVVTHQYAQSINYSATLTVTSTDGITAQSSRTVTASGGVLAAFTATPGSGQPPLEVLFDGSTSQAFGSTVVSWNWEFGDGQTGTGETISHTYSSAGIYRVTLTVEDDRSRTGTDSLEIRVNTPPVASFTVEPTSGNVPLTVTVNAAASDDPDGQIVRYDWDFGDGTVIENGDLHESHTYEQAGEFIIRLTIEDNDGATAEATHPVTAVSSEFPPCENNFEGDLRARTIAELNALAGVCHVNGNLTIDEINGLENLDILLELTSVNGDFTIYRNEDLASAAGLSMLSHVSGTLSFERNPSLITIGPMSHLSHIGSLGIDRNEALVTVMFADELQIVNEVFIDDNPVLQSLSGFGQLASLGGQLQIRRNPNLADLPPFGSLERVLGDLRISDTASDALPAFSSLRRVEGDLIVDDNPNLSQCDFRRFEQRLREAEGIGGEITTRRNAHMVNSASIATAADMATLNGICEIRDNLSIGSSVTVTDMSGADSLLYVGGSLLISQNSSITSLNGLNNLRFAGAVILQNTALTDLSGLANLKSVRTVNIGFNSALANLQGLEGLQFVEEALALSSNSELVTVAALSGLQSVHDISINNSPKLENVDFQSPPIITGDLSLNALPQVSALDGLASLKEVGGRLSVGNLTGLNNFDGLRNIERIGVELRLNQTPGFENIGAFESLKELGGLDFSNMSGLTSLEGIEAITSINGNFQLTTIPALTDFTGLEALTEIGGDLNVTNCSGLTSFAGLEALRETGDFRLQNNQALSDISALGMLTRIGGDLAITSSPNLASLDVFSGLQDFSSMLNLGLLPALSALPSLSNISELSGLRLVSNASLQSLSGLEAVTRVSGTVQIEGSPLLEDMTGIGNLTEAGGIVLRHNNGMESLQGLNNVVTTGLLSLTNMPGLSDLSGLDNLESVDGSFFVSNNAALTSLGGAPALMRVDGELSIGGGNALLTNLSGLEAITEVGLLTVSGANSLVNLKGLDGLTDVTVHLRIGQNSALSSLEGLEQLERVGSWFTIHQNSSLPQCLAHALVQQVQGRRGIGGTITIEGNDVQAVCE